NFQTMGAIGAALLALENYEYTQKPSSFHGWKVKDLNFVSLTHECSDCSNNCEVITIVEGELEVLNPKSPKEVKGNIVARWGGTCGKWDRIV
ncbi:MAG: hypothetical protein ACOYWZ_00870, partial [Bacillota bacterium]